MAAILLDLGSIGLPAAVAPAPATDAVVLTVEGAVEVFKSGAAEWQPVSAGSGLKTGERLRTGERSRATVRLTDLSVFRVPSLTTIEILPPVAADQGPGLNLLRGLVYFFSRERPQAVRVRTPVVSAAIRGTEFMVAVAATGDTVLSLFDGALTLDNRAGTLDLAGGEQATINAGEAPRKAPMLEFATPIQWCLYYPGILEPRDLSWSESERALLAASLEAYRGGNLREAWSRFPVSLRRTSASSCVYEAALLLAFGEVDKARRTLEFTPSQAVNDVELRLGRALQHLMATVQGRSQDPLVNGAGASATEWMADSYYYQARGQLAPALNAARRATRLSPEFGYAWVRVAELEFSFGRTGAAQVALDQGKNWAPGNAQAMALRGFVACAANRWADALEAFSQALVADGQLANGWLGRGLVRLHRGDRAAGFQDLQVAATLEPQRSLLRSYLGKAFSQAGDAAHAAQELELARRLDPRDPTPWFYGALMLWSQRRVNEAIADLDQAQARKDNRRIFRSGLLLDQDRAVRGVNLAAMYREAGMDEVSRREAARAVNDDYANASAHLFLAESYDQLRDPQQINLRYEAPWASELLVSQLLAPPGAGSLSQQISQQEYTRLFERDHVGISSATEYRSNGEWYESASQFGVFGGTSYALDAVFASQHGYRPNADATRLTLNGKIKQQITPQDSVLLYATEYQAEAGDVRQYYDPADASTTLRFKERQEPNLFLGYHREWSPGNHTLFLAGRLADEFWMSEPRYFIPTLQLNSKGYLTGLALMNFGEQYYSSMTLYSAELQQVWQAEKLSLIAGGRLQSGQLEAENTLTRSSKLFPAGLISSPMIQTETADVSRISAYLYGQWQLFDSLRAFAGLSYDQLRYPVNLDNPPLQGGEREASQVSPKAGLRWEPGRDFTVRAAFTRSLSGAYMDGSLRLEPTQIAGFNQAYRSIIPESVSGLIPGAAYDTWGVSIEKRFATRTYLGLEGEILSSEADSGSGMFRFVTRPAQPGLLSESWNFREQTLRFTINQLLGRTWAVGTDYQVSRAELTERWVGIPEELTPQGSTQPEAVLQQARLFVVANHASGVFARAETLWFKQHNSGYQPALADDDFWHLNTFLGYRFPRRHAELRLGVLNWTGQDYRLNPLNWHAELARARTFTVSCRFEF